MPLTHDASRPRVSQQKHHSPARCLFLSSLKRLIVCHKDTRSRPRVSGPTYPAVKKPDSSQVREPWNQWSSLVVDAIAEPVYCREYRPGNKRNRGADVDSELFAMVWSRTRQLRVDAGQTKVGVTGWKVVTEASPALPEGCSRTHSTCQIIEKTRVQYGNIGRSRVDHMRNIPFRSLFPKLRYSHVANPANDHASLMPRPN